MLIAGCGGNGERHEQLTLRMVFATFQHHSAPRIPETARTWAGERELYTAQRHQEPPLLPGSGRRVGEAAASARRTADAEGHHAAVPQMAGDDLPSLWPLDQYLRQYAASGLEKQEERKEEVAKNKEAEERRRELRAVAEPDLYAEVLTSIAAKDWARAEALSAAAARQGRRRGARGGHAERARAQPWDELFLWHLIAVSVPAATSP